MKVAFVEFADQVAALERHASASSQSLDEFRIIALEPAVQAALTARGIAHETPVAYFTNESHAAMIRETERAVLWLTEVFRFRDSGGVERSYLTDLCHHVRVYLNLLYAQVEIVANVARAHPGAELVAFADGLYGSSASFTGSERPLGELLRSHAGALGIRHTLLPPAPPPAAQQDSLLSRLGDRWSAAALRALLGSVRRRPVVLVQRKGRMFARLLPELQAEYPGVAFVSIDHSAAPAPLVAANVLGVSTRVRSTSALLGAINRDRYYSINLDWLQAPVSAGEQRSLDAAIDKAFDDVPAGVLSYEGVDCTSIVRNKAGRGLRAHLHRLLRASAGVRLMLERFDVRLVLSYSALGVMSVAAEAARLTGRPSLMVSHGAHPAPVNEVHELELRNQCRGFMLGEYSHAALCVPAHESHLDYFRGRYPWVRTEGLRSGNLIFARVDRARRADCRRHFGASDGDLVLTHAVTLKPRGHSRFYYIETASECLDSLRELIAAVDGCDGVRLIVRPHPGIGLTAADLSRLLPASSRVAFSHAEPFGDVLSATDVLISYSSTTIEEALMNGIPVVLYDRYRRYNHGGIPVGALEPGTAHPMLYASTPKELHTAVDHLRSRLAVADGFDFTSYRYTGDFDAYRAFISETLRAGQKSGVA